MTDASQTVVWRWDRDAFGFHNPDENPDGLAPSDRLDLRFPGQIRDVNSGLYYNYYRDYDPASGRYMQSDPIGLAGGLNTYTHANGNPVKYVDPLGLIAWECTSFKTSGGIGPLDFGQIIYTCKSECLDGKRTVTQIQVLLTGPGFGFGGEMTGGNSTITDGNASPNTGVFSGEYAEVSAGASWGIGYGIGQASFNRGKAKGSLSGPQAGIGYGAGEQAGTSKVIWERVEKCNQNQCK